MANLLSYAGTAGLNTSQAGGITMAASNPVLERIATYPWLRGGVQARCVRGRLHPDIGPHGCSLWPG